MRSLSAVLAALLLAAAAPTDAATPPEYSKGGMAYSLPQWFKPSFLDFRQDVAEARMQGRHVMVFLHLDDCPYCARMLEESFASGDNRDFMEQHFDVIAVNVRGSLEVRWIDGATYTEKGLAGHLRVMGTPTIVFLDPDSNQVLQIVGYRDPRALRAALDYVQAKSYRSRRFVDEAGDLTRLR